MRPLSRAAAVVFLCAALPASAVDRPQLDPKDKAAVEALPPQDAFPHFENALNKDADPAAAGILLAADGMLEKLKKADPERFEKLFQRATELADVDRILREHTSPAGLRQALDQRRGFDMLADSSALLAWAKKSGAYDYDLLRKALLEWDTLDPEMSKAVAAGGVTAQAWAKAGLAGRQAAIGKVTEKALTDFTATVPRSKADLDALLARARKLNPYLDSHSSHKLWDYYNRAQSAVEGLAEARKAAGANPPPEVKAALAQAMKEGSLDGMLGKLGKVFDGMKPRGGAPEPAAAAAVRRAAPAEADQQFTPQQRATYTEMLKHSMLEEMKGTVAGERLRAFYKKEPFNLVVKPMGPGTMGLYQSGSNTVSVSEDMVLKFVRGEGRKAEDLLKDPALFKQVSQAVLSTVVHEGIHQEQEAWRRDHDLPHWYVVEHEVEAKSREAAFVLEKASKDPAYAKFMSDPAVQEKLTFVRSASIIASDLRRDPVAFEEGIRTRYYAGVASIETQARFAAEDPAFVREMHKGIVAELARREAMSPAERARFDATTVPRTDGMVRTAAEGVALMSTFKTEALRERVRLMSQRLAEDDKRRLSAASDYAAFVARDRRMQVEVGGVLAMLSPTPGMDGRGMALGAGDGGGSSPPRPGTAAPKTARPPAVKTAPRTAPRGSTVPFLPAGHENCSDPSHGHPRVDWP